MKTQADNIPTILDHVLQMSHLVTDDAWMLKKVLFDVMDQISDLDFDRAPAELHYDCLRNACKILGVTDPYEEQKALAVETLLPQLPDIKGWIEQQKDPFHGALLACIAGAKVIDFSTVDDIGTELDSLLDRPFGIHHYAQLLADIDEADNVLYVLNNVSEAFFDLMAVQQLVAKGKKVTVVVRHSPILDDITAAEAEAIGFNDVAEITHPGVDMLGVVVSLASRKFQSMFFEADIVIAKGIANCETLLNCKRDVYFLLSGHSTCVSQALGVKKNELVLMKGGKNVTT